MTKDEVIALAREAGLVRTGDKWTEPARWGVAEIEHFAALVAAHEREECAKVCDEEANDLSCGEDWNECGGYLAKTIRSRSN